LEEAMMAKKKKKPNTQTNPSTRRQPVQGAKVSAKKRPVPAPDGDADGSDRLVFGLQLLDHEGPYAWAGMSATDTKLIADTCKSWESMSANEVFAAGGNKPIPLENLCPDAQTRLKQIDLEEYNGQWWELRVSGERRIWGVRQRHVFYVVWWDPNHRVCPSIKRHT
jgi:hypothetical protein